MKIRAARQYVARLVRRDSFGSAVMVSVVLHAAVLAFLPREAGGHATVLVIRSLSFVSGGGIDSAGSVAGLPWENLPSPQQFSSVDFRQLDGRAREESLAAREPGAPGLNGMDDKLSFRDKVGRRPVVAVDRGPRFYDVLKERISESCVRNVPNELRTAGQGRVVVLYVTVLSSGTLESVEVVKSSGMADLDHASVRAVRLAAPFQSFPAGLDWPRLKLQVPVVYDFTKGDE